MFGMRLGDNPRVVATTTPRPTELIRQLASAPTTFLTRGSTYENRAHLAPSFLEDIERRFGQTRIGRQEIYGEILDDNPGAIFHLVDIEKARVRHAPSLLRIVIAIDPAVSHEETSDLTGIVVVGLGADLHAYVLDDVSGRYTPAQWARKAIDAFRTYRADRIIGEINQGGALVEANLRTVDPRIPYRGVRASRGKRVRAEPVAALYEQGRVHHVGMLAALEDEMVGWDPVVSTKSPDRMDALVYGVSELLLTPQMVRRRVQNLPPG
jgi:predicted phage terminase large subunit-like protein